MLARVKLAMRIQTTVFDSELLGLIASALADIRHVGIEFDSAAVEDGGEITDYTVTDPLIQTLIILYCKLYFGAPEDFDRLKSAYDEQKGQLREAKGYGLVDVRHGGEVVV